MHEGVINTRLNRLRSVLLDTGSNVHFSSLALTVDLDRAGDLKEDWPIDVIRSVNLFIVKPKIILNRSFDNINCTNSRRFYTQPRKGGEYCGRSEGARTEFNF